MRYLQVLSTCKWAKSIKIKFTQGSIQAIKHSELKTEITATIKNIRMILLLISCKLKAEINAGI